MRKGQSALSEQVQQILHLMEAVEGQLLELDSHLQEVMDEKGSPLTSLGLRAPLAMTIETESQPIADFKLVKEYVAYTGLEPETKASGQFTSQRTPITKRGSPHLRMAYYLAASSLFRKHKALERVYRRSRKQGRHHTDAMVIVAHKLARICWRLMTDNRDFQKRAPSKRK